MRAAVVVNPVRVAGAQGLVDTIRAALVAAGSPDPICYETTEDDPGGGQVKAAIAAGAEVVFVCGGDGTVRACVDELAGTDVALAVVPGGTGNLLVANLGLPSDVESVVAAALGGRRRRIDLGRLDGAHFAMMAGVGFDAAMMESTPEPLKRRIGWLAYLIGGARRLFDRPMRVLIRLDGAAPLRRTARTVLVANVGRLQGGIDLFDDACPDDGVLDVAVLTPRGPTDWWRLALGVLTRRPSPHRVETFRASTVVVDAATVEPREMDGDAIEPGRRLEVSVRPRALSVCVP
jgi:diacylglycerol kinase family enzyme